MSLLSQLVSMAAAGLMLLSVPLDTADLLLMSSQCP